MSAMAGKICEICGAPLTGNRTRFCSEKCYYKYRYRQRLDMKVQRTCPICGTAFETSMGLDAKTCSRACRNALKSRSQSGSVHPWSQEARENLRQRPTPPQLALGVSAAMELPEGQRGPQNRGAKLWILLSPEGELVEAVNLIDWARNNLSRFDEQGEDGARRIASGIRQIAQCMRGKTKRSVTSYKGWQLLSCPQPKRKENENP